MGGEYKERSMNSINTGELTDSEVRILNNREIRLQERVGVVLKARGFSTQTIALFVLHAQLDSIVSRERDWSTSRMVQFFLNIYAQVQDA